MEKFKINEFITLKLENGTINIYVNGQYFNQCMYLLFIYLSLYEQFKTELKTHIKEKFNVEINK